MMQKRIEEGLKKTVEKKNSKNFPAEITNKNVIWMNMENN